MRGKQSRHRSGSTLILVVVILAVLGLGAYQFAEYSMVEYRGLRAGVDEVRGFQAAESGVDYAAAALQPSAENWNPELTLHDSTGDTWHVMLRGGSPWSAAGRVPGIVDECSKLNLNSLATDVESEVESRNRLLAIPGMTEVMADSLLDWIDEDETPRQYGAESNWYLSSGYPYTPRQGSFRSLSELLLVRGVRADLLWGDDADGSGWLESNERARAATPLASTRGTSPWCEWLTVVSSESSFNKRGQPRIDLNQESLPSLYRQLERVAGVEAARFVVAMRMNGPIGGDGTGRFDSEEEQAKRLATAASRAQAQTELTLNFSESNVETVGGLRLRSPVYRIDSVVQLIDRRVEASLFDTDVILTSPWTTDASRLATSLAWLDEHLTTFSEQSNPGRINPNSASSHVLRTIPNLSPDLATAITKRQNSQRSGLAWLVEERLMTLQQLQAFSKYLTGGGDVYAGVAYGRVGNSPRLAPISFLIDRTAWPPLIQNRIRRPSLPIAQLESGL